MSKKLRGEVGYIQISMKDRLVMLNSETSENYMEHKKHKTRDMKSITVYTGWCKSQKLHFQLTKLTVIRTFYIAENSNINLFPDE